jgi:4-amino-4-deoxy-L-arabinose transferase-like glycosyltransferase
MISALSLLRQKTSLYLMILILMWASLFLMRWFAPSDLLDKDQERPAAYMADAALNGNWIVQIDDHGRVCSKPPVYTWLGAGLILLIGHVNEFALYFPSALGVLGCCLLMWYCGGRRFGYQTAFVGVSFFLLSSLGIRILYLARTDALFAFATFLTACIGFGCRCKNWNWVWFWLAAALATLTKGPLGLVLAAGGLIGLIKIPASGAGQARRGMLSGALLYLALCLGWLWLAYMQMGDAVIAKIIGRELYGHTNWGSDRFSVDYFFFIIPTLFFLSRFFPWSIFTLMGLWRVWKKPATEVNERLFERFVASYLLFGVMLFSVFPHQRADHLFPLLPAAGLLAGREVIRLVTRRNLGRHLLPAILGLWLFVWAAFSLYYFKIDPATNPWFAKTGGVQQLARRFEARIGNTDRLYFVDTPYGFQFYLNTMKPRISYEKAAELLKGDDAVIVSVRSLETLKKRLPPSLSLHMIMRWPETGDAFMLLVSNRIKPI